MYFDTPVNIPDSKKISIKNGKYVLYETGRTYYKEKKYNVPTRVTIGKKCEPGQDGRTGKMLPKREFWTYFPNEVIPETETDQDEKDKERRSSCLHIGVYLVISAVLAFYGLTDTLKKIFEDDAGLFIDLVAYSITEESNAAQYYPDYAYNHVVFTDNFRIYSDSTVCRFFQSITDDQRLGFLEEWNSGEDHGKRVYISYDSTNKNVQSGDIEIAEFGHAKDDPTKPVVNVSVGYNHTNQKPLFYEEYPGSIVDVSQLDYMISKAQGYGYRNIGFIIDRGYFSKDNLDHIEEAGYSFVVMAKGRQAFIRALVSKAMGSFESDRGCRIRKYKVYGKTVREKLFESDERERYVHVYYSDTKGAAGREKIERDIDRLEKNLKKIVGKKGSVEGAERYFKLIYNSEGTLLKYREKTKAIDEEKSFCGYFVIVTSKKMSAEAALLLYKSRDESEKLFRADKSFLGNTAYRVQEDESLDAKVLVGFVAMIIRDRIFTCLDEEQERNERKANYMTVPAAIRELEKIEIIKLPDGKYRLDHAITATQKAILKAFDMTASNAVKEINSICEKLSNAKAKAKKRRL